VLLLIRRLTKKVHRDIAMAQDLMVNVMYNVFSDVVIHGGTAMWRCYGGNRFSEDIDVYLPLKYRKREKYDEFIDAMEQVGFKTEKFKDTGNVIYSKFSMNGVIVSFEALFKNVKNIVTMPFEMIDGNFINVYTLSSEALLAEKTLTYLSRRKIRDLYDIFFLLNVVNEKVDKKLLRKFLSDFKLPIDTKDLKVLIISGAVPSVSDMLLVIKRRCS
jgi:predicted nucleotidyltransferase component of viral defense system